MNDNPEFGYNVATDKYEDLMPTGIIDPTKVSYDNTSTLETFFDLRKDYIYNCFTNVIHVFGYILGGEMLFGACFIGGNDILDVRLCGCRD